MQELNFNKIREVGIIDNGAKAYNYGSKFFLISEEKELLSTPLYITSKKPLFAPEIQDEERYEYLEDVRYSNENNYTISAVLDIENCFIKGHEVDLYEDTIDEIDFLYCSSVDCYDYDSDDEEYEKLLNVCRIIYDDEDIESLSVLDLDEDEYVSFVVLENEIVVYTDDGLCEEIRYFSLDKKGNVNGNNRELAYCSLMGKERIMFDKCSLLTLDEIEKREKYKYIEYINSLTPKDIPDVVIAEVLDMNYKSLNKSTKKDMYFELYKQKLINIIMN